MKSNRAVVIAFILLAVVSAFVAGSFLPLSHAQDRAAQSQLFGQLQAIPYISGYTGFFDRNTGTVYVYDTSMEKCIFIRQLVRPGEPMKKILN